MAWYAYGRSQGLDSNFGTKLLTSGIGLASRFILCEDEGTTFYAGYCVQPRYGADLRVLKKILNSPLLDFYIHHTSRSYQHGYKAFTKAFLDPFGIPQLSPAEQTLVLSVSRCSELVTFLLDKYQLDVSTHAVLDEFLANSPKMDTSLPTFDPTPMAPGSLLSAKEAAATARTLFDT